MGLDSPFNPPPLSLSLPKPHPQSNPQSLLSPQLFTNNPRRIHTHTERLRCRGPPSPARITPSASNSPTMYFSLYDYCQRLPGSALSTLGPAPKCDQTHRSRPLPDQDVLVQLAFTPHQRRDLWDLCGYTAKGPWPGVMYLVYSRE